MLICSLYTPSPPCLSPLLSILLARCRWYQHIHSFYFSHKLLGMLPFLVITCLVSL